MIILYSRVSFLNELKQYGDAISFQFVVLVYKDGVPTISLKLYFFFLLVGNKTITDIKINRKSKKSDENNKENEGKASGKV